MGMKRFRMSWDNFTIAAKNFSCMTSAELQFEKSFLIERKS